MFPRVSFSAALPIGLMSALGALVLIARRQASPSRLSAAWRSAFASAILFSRRPIDCNRPVLA